MEHIILTIVLIICLIININTMDCYFKWGLFGLIITSIALILNILGLFIHFNILAFV